MPSNWAIINHYFVMNKLDSITITPGHTNGTVYVRVSRGVSGDFGIITRKTGFIEVDTVANAEKLVAALKDKSVVAQMSGQANQQGNYTVTVLPAGASEEASAQAAEKQNELQHEA